MTGVIAVAHHGARLPEPRDDRGGGDGGDRGNDQRADVETAAGRRRDGLGSGRSGVAGRPSVACWAVTTSSCDCAQRGAAKGLARHRGGTGEASPLVLADARGRKPAAARAYARTAMPAAARCALASATVCWP